MSPMAERPAGATFGSLVHAVLEHADPFAADGLEAELCRRVSDQLRWWPVAVAALWVAEEAVRDRLPFGGFPWGRWAFSQAESPLKWFAPLGGAPLVPPIYGPSGDEQS